MANEFAKRNLDTALKFLNELDSTPLGEIGKKLDRIAEAVAAAKMVLVQDDQIQLRRPYDRALAVIADMCGAGLPAVQADKDDLAEWAEEFTDQYYAELYIGEKRP